MGGGGSAVARSSCWAQAVCKALLVTLVLLLLLRDCGSSSSSAQSQSLSSKLTEKEADLQAVLSSYRTYQSRVLEIDTKHPGAWSSSSTSRDREKLTKMSTHAHTNVVFVGFPAASVEMLQSTWFASLGREDVLLATLGSAGETVKLPGRVTVQHHFHLVQVSFHVSDVLGELLTSLVDHGQVNVWEFEDALNDLASVIANANTSSTAAAATTVFMLNLKLPFEYEYTVGLDEASLQLLCQNKEILELARQVLRQVKRPVRIEEGLGGTSKSLIGRAVPGASVLLPEGSLASAKAALSRWEGRQILDDNTNSSSSSSSSSSKSSRVYVKDLVKETRTWAKRYAPLASAAGDGRKSLESRARRILGEVPVSAPGVDPVAKAAQRLAFARSLLEAAASSGTTGDTLTASRCSSQSWLGSGRVVWTDLRASHSPPIDSMLGASLEVPAPRLMDEKEWLQLGAANARRDLGAEVLRGRTALRRHEQAVRSLYAQAHCPVEVLEDASGSHMSDGMTFGSFIARIAYDAYPSFGFLRPSCAILVMQIALLIFAQRHSEELETAISAYEEAGKESGDFEALLVRETRESHLRALTAVLQASNVLVDTPHAHAGLVSHDAGIYLGYIGSLMQLTARFVTSPPLALYLDAYHPDLPMPRTLVQAQWGAIPSKANKQQLENHRRLAAITPDVSVSSHARSGDSLLDYVRSADHAALEAGHADVEVDTEGHVDSIEAVAQTADELRLWDLLFPPLIFPAKLEVKVYVVQVQQTYEPLLRSADDARGQPARGFDYTSLMQQLSRLRLPAQALIVTIETIQPAVDPAVALALAACARKAIIPSSSHVVSSSEGQRSSREVNYLDSNCVWVHVQHYDDTDVSKGVPHSRGASKFVSTTQSVSLLLLSLDTPQPTYIDNEYQTVTSVGHAVLAVQNEQRFVPTGYTCGGRESSVDGRNPMPAVARQLGRIIAGLPPKSTGHCGAPSATSLMELALGSKEGNDSTMSSIEPGSNVRVDPSVFFGQSPSFSANSFVSGPALFSTLEIEASHRARVMRALGVARAELDRLVAIEHPKSEWDAPPSLEGEEGSRSSRWRWGPLTGLYDSALEALEQRDWSGAASLSNAAHYLLREVRSGREVPVEFESYFQARDGQNTKEAMSNHAPVIDIIAKETTGSFWVDAACLCVATVASFFVTQSIVRRGKRKGADSSDYQHHDGLPVTANANMMTPPTTMRYTEL